MQPTGTDQNLPNVKVQSSPDIGKIYDVTGDEGAAHRNIKSKNWL